jgi:hypothetical protein
MEYIFAICINGLLNFVFAQSKKQLRTRLVRASTIAGRLLKNTMLPLTILLQLTWCARGLKPNSVLIIPSGWCQNDFSSCYQSE